MLEFIQSSFFSGLLLVIYSIVIIGVAIQVIYDSISPSKTMGYLLLIIFIPLLGVILYLSIGVNYRNRRMYTKKISSNKEMESQVKKYVRFLKHEALQSNNPSIKAFEKLAYCLSSDPIHWLSLHNKAELLNNGEEKFPAVLEALESAVSTIHMEYYIVRDDDIGQKIKEVLIRKAKEGIKVRFIYDDFGGRFIRKKYAKDLQNAGVEIYAFRKIIFIAFANRLNYRNHRKIIVIDGKIGFVGGINIGNEYINDGKERKKYWRDVHLRLEGYSCYSLQYIFLSDWNFCAKQNIEASIELFPLIEPDPNKEGQTVQIVASGPDSPEPMIMNSIIMALALAKREILITTPYFVPSEPVIMMMMMAARSKVKVKILIPKKTDSEFVSIASRSLFGRLMEAGVEIYLYDRGFIHSKTSIFDRKLAFVGTANIDNRSFYLNFEVNAAIYDEAFSQQMADDFFEDLKYAEMIDYEMWKKRSRLTVFFDKIIYLTSSLL